MGSTRGLLEMKQGRYKYFGFSTKHPDGVMGLIGSRIK
jgi:hypothetical protein